MACSRRRTRAVCDKVHAAGGQVYIDGANFNALVGVAKPGKFGGDVSHSICTRHSVFRTAAGGQAWGRWRFANIWLPFYRAMASTPSGKDRRSAAQPFGSASILPISWMYIRMMGPAGTAACDPSRHSQRQLRRTSAEAALPDPVYRQARFGRSRVHHRHPADGQGRTRHRRRHRQTADRFRIPCADDVIPRRRNADG